MNLSDTFLNNIPIFSELQLELQKEIINAGEICDAEINEFIVSEDEQKNSFLVVLKGKIKISRKDELNNEITLMTLTESENYGFYYLFEHFSKPVSVIAMEESKVFIIHRKDFLDLVNSNDLISNSLLEIFAGKVKANENKLKSLSHGNTEKKVALALLQITDDIGLAKNGAVEIEKLPELQAIAELSSTSRETITKIIANFVKKGLVEVEGNKLRILNYEDFKKTYDN